MNITQITVSYGETQSLPEYSNVKPNLTITAVLEEGDIPEKVERMLWHQAKESVHEQIDLALESSGLAAKYSTDPRFRVQRTYQGYTARGKIEQPKIVVVFPNETRLDESLGSRLGSPSYRETNGLRYEHAMRIAGEYSRDQGYLLLDCADGDLTKLLALLPEEKAEEPDALATQIDARPAEFEPEVDFDEDEDEDE